MKNLVLVRGKSMHPYLKEGDLLVFEKISPESACRGDLVVVRTEPDSTLLVHRYFGKQSIKGDRNLCEDGPVYAGLEIVGRINARMHEFKTYTLYRGLPRKLQTELARLNHQTSNPFFRKIWVTGILVLGQFLRGIEMSTASPKVINPKATHANTR